MKIKQLLIAAIFLILTNARVMAASQNSSTYCPLDGTAITGSSPANSNGAIINLIDGADNQNRTPGNDAIKTNSYYPSVINSCGENIPLNNITTDGAEAANSEIVTISADNKTNNQSALAKAVVENTGLVNTAVPNSMSDTSQIKLGKLDIATLNQMSLPPGSVIISNTLTPPITTAISTMAPLPVSIASPVSPPNPARRLIAEQRKLIPGAITLAHNFGNDEANKLAQAGITIGCNTADNYLYLDNGNVLFSPDADIVIGTSKGKVSIGSGATVFIMESDKDVVLYDLHQTKPKQVCITVNRERLVMEPGRMLVLTKQKTDDFKKLSVPCHSVAYRKAQEINLEDNAITVFAADFSICSALTRLQPLKKLLSSSDKREQSIVDGVLRGAIALEAYAHHS